MKNNIQLAIWWLLVPGSDIRSAMLTCQKGEACHKPAHSFFPFLFFSLNKKQLIVTVPYVTQQCTKTTIKKNPCLIDCLMLMAIRHVFWTSPPCYIEHQAPGFHSGHNTYIITADYKNGSGLIKNRWRAWIATALRAIVHGKRINTPRNWMINWSLGNVFPW